MNNLLYNATGMREEIFSVVYKIYTDNFKLTNDADLADIVLCADTPVDLSIFPNHKFVVCNMTNTNHLINLDESKCISLKGTFLDNIYSTAHHTIYLLLSLVRRHSRYYYPGESLVLKKIGIIGNGRVGKQVASLCEALGMVVLRYDKGDEIPRDLDFYSIHISVEKNQKPVMDRSFLESLKNGVYIINTARPEAIDSRALAANLKRFSGFASDFFDDNLSDFENITMTSHTGGWCMEDLLMTSEHCYLKLLERLPCIE